MVFGILNKEIYSVSLLANYGSKKVRVIGLAYFGQNSSNQMWFGQRSHSSWEVFSFEQIEETSKLPEDFQDLGWSTSRCKTRFSRGPLFPKALRFLPYCWDRRFGTMSTTWNSLWLCALFNAMESNVWGHRDTQSFNCGVVSNLCHTISWHRTQTYME